MIPDADDILRPEDVFRDPSWAYRFKRARGYARMTAACARFLAGVPRIPPAPCDPFAKHSLTPEFFAMNVCPSPNPAGDAVQIEALRDLGVEAVRVDYGARSVEGPADRLIERLLDGGFRVTLHAVQDPADAAAMDQKKVRDEWCAFLRRILERFGNRLEALEPGSTPNRHSWSGYTVADYAWTARSAQDVLDSWAGARGARPLLLGPNVNDFAPYFTVTLLDACRRRRVRFDVLTDNLFFDRVGEPEAFDPHALGAALNRVARMDMVRKQRILAAVARHFAIGRTWCTYGHYTLGFSKPRRRYVNEEQYANYMVRSNLLTAAAGAFERYYWGTLVAHFKGLIDEGLRVRPYPPFAHHRFAIDGEPSLWKRRESLFRTYATMTRLLKGLTFVRRWETEPATTVLEFAGPGKRVVAGWTRDGQTSRLHTALPESGALPTRCLAREGDEREPTSEAELSPSPSYLIYTTEPISKELSWSAPRIACTHSVNPCDP